MWVREARMCVGRVDSEACGAIVGDGVVCGCAGAVEGIFAVSEGGVAVVPAGAFGFGVVLGLFVVCALTVAATPKPRTSATTAVIECFIGGSSINCCVGNQVTTDRPSHCG